METRRGGMGEAERVEHKRLHLSHTRSLAPSPFSLLSPGASRQGVCWASSPAHRAPSALSCGPQPLSCLKVRTGAGTQAGLPDTRCRRPALLSAQFRGSSAYTPQGSRQRPLPPSGRPLPRLQRRVPSAAPDAVLSSLPQPPFECPPGAAPIPSPSPLQAAASQVLPAPPRSRADTV